MHLTSLHVDATTGKAKIWLSEKLNRLFYKRIDRWLSYRVFVVVIKSRLYWSPIYMESDWTCNPTNQSSRSLGPVGSGWQSGKAQFKFIRREIWSVWRYKSYCKQIFGHTIWKPKKVYIFSPNWTLPSLVLVSFKARIQLLSNLVSNFEICCYLFSNKSKIVAANLLNPFEGNKYQSKNIVVQSLWISSHKIHFTLKFKPSHSKKGSIFLSLCKGKEKCPNCWIIHKCQSRAGRVRGLFWRHCLFSCHGCIPCLLELNISDKERKKSEFLADA